MSRFAKCLTEMADRAGRAHRVEGELEIAGKLKAEHIKGTKNRQKGGIDHEDDQKAEVQCSDSATIHRGAFVVRTAVGTKAYGRTHSDQYVYVPFRAGGAHNACVMRISQLLLVKRAGMGWPNDEARFAVGKMWDHLAVRKGVGLETHFNDDPALGACTIPRALFLAPKRRRMGYRIAVFLRQIHCPCVYIPDPAGDTFMTVGKMGYHGRMDLQWESGSWLPCDEDCDER